MKGRVYDTRIGCKSVFLDCVGQYESRQEFELVSEGGHGAMPSNFVQFTLYKLGTSIVCETIDPSLYRRVLYCDLLLCNKHTGLLRLSPFYPWF